MMYYAALDGGGTHTRCAVADGRHVLGRSAAGTVKLSNVDRATATARVRQLLVEAAARAGVGVGELGRICFGLAGSSSPEVKLWAAETCRGLAPGAHLLLTGDEETAFEAAFEGGPGVFVIAGTGMNVMGRTLDGRRFGAGGWGPVLGDEGSGYWIGLEAIRAGLRAEERGHPSSLLAAIERFWGLGSRAELVAFAHHRERPAFGDLAVVVTACAAQGDALAQAILQRAGEELADAVDVVVRRVHEPGQAAPATARVAYTGSVLGRIAPVRHAFQASLRQRWPFIQVDEDAVEPLDGALWLARSHA